MTAVTIAKTHEGDWILLAGPDVPLAEQHQAFRHARVSPAHDLYSEIRYQDDHGAASTIRFRTPEAQAEFATQQHAQRAAHQRNNAPPDTAAAAEAAAQADRDKAEVDAHSENILRITGQTQQGTPPKGSLPIASTPLPSRAPAPADSGLVTEEVSPPAAPEAPATVKAEPVISDAAKRLRNPKK